MTRQIIMTEADNAKLRKMINEILYSEVDGVGHVRVLDAEMNLARLAPAGKVPPDVITMHSRVVLSFDGDGEEEYTLVYPDEADLSENRVSVLSPVGTAILGYRAGDIIRWGRAGRQRLYPCKKAWFISRKPRAKNKAGVKASAARLWGCPVRTAAF